MILRKMHPKNVFRLAMVALIVASLGQRFLDPTADFARGLLYGLFFGLIGLSMWMMRRQRTSCGT
jgi:hypothetical protein